MCDNAVSEIPARDSFEVVNVARPLDPAKIDDAIALYKSGKTVGECASAVGIGYNTLYRKLHSRGVFESRRKHITPTTLTREFLDGESVKALAAKYRVDRNAIYRMLREAGIDGRNRSDAMLLRWQRATPEQRAALSESTRRFMTGRIQSPEHRARIALTRAGRVFSADETALADLLRDHGLEVDLGVPCGRYNLDLVISSAVAVEVFGGQWHETGRHRARFAERSRYIFDAGYSLAIVWTDKARYPVGVPCAKNLATLTQITCGDPSIGRQHWVIRGDGHFLAVREDDGNEVPFITSAGRSDR